MFTKTLKFFSFSFYHVHLINKNNVANLVITKAYIHNCRQICIFNKLLKLHKNYLMCSTQQKHRTSNDFDETKAKLVLQMNFKAPEDALPFYKLPKKSLLHIYKTIKNDEHNKHCMNRLYYIADRIQYPPSEVSKYLANRHFVYSLSFDWLEQSLNVLLEMKVSADRILRDLWVLKYHHKTIRERLQKVKDAGIINLYPWMVRCTEDILIRYISIYQETKTILGDIKSTHSYLAKRLNISIEEVEKMCIKVPSLKTIRVTKVKHFLDYLEKEGFEVEEIVKKPKILSSSQKTTGLRLKKLRELGVKNINLNILCSSRKLFEKYYETIQAMIKKGENVDIEG